MLSLNGPRARFTNQVASAIYNLLVADLPYREVLSWPSQVRAHKICSNPLSWACTHTTLIVSPTRHQLALIPTHSRH